MERSVWECVHCMCHMCYVISACQARVSGINKHATKIMELESDTHTHTRDEWCGEYERNHVSGISLQCT